MRANRQNETKRNKIKQNAENSRNEENQNPFVFPKLFDFYF